MIATVKKPRIEMRGNIPEGFIELTRKYFGSDDVEVVVEKDDEYVSIDDTAWAKKREGKHSPGRNLKNYREMRGLTQTQLAEKLNVLQHHISGMETGSAGSRKTWRTNLLFSSRFLLNGLSEECPQEELFPDNRSVIGGWRKAKHA